MARIPVFIIHAVQDSDQRAGAGPQHLLQAHAVLGRADLGSVGGADGGDRIRVHAAVLERIDAPGTQVILVQQVGVVAETQVRERGGRELALVADVVDGEHGAGRGEQPVPAVEGAQQQGSETGMPVMAVQDLRTPPEVLQHSMAMRVRPRNRRCSSGARE